MESPRKRPILSHRDQLIAVGLVGILAFTLFFALFLLPRFGSNNSLHQSVTISGYVFIGNKGNPTYVNFDNPTTGMITGNAAGDKSYSASLITGYDYSVTVTYLPSGAYSYSTCVPSPSSVTTIGTSSTLQQDFSC